MPKFDAFADDAAWLGIGEPTLENGRERVAVYGSPDLTWDEAGLKQAPRHRG